MSKLTSPRSRRITDPGDAVLISPDVANWLTEQYGAPVITFAKSFFRRTPEDTREDAGQLRFRGWLVARCRQYGESSGPSEQLAPYAFATLYYTTGGRWVSTLKCATHDRNVGIWTAESATRAAMPAAHASMLLLVDDAAFLSLAETALGTAHARVVDRMRGMNDQPTEAFAIVAGLAPRALGRRMPVNGGGSVPVGPVRPSPAFAQVAPRAPRPTRTARG